MNWIHLVQDSDKESAVVNKAKQPWLRFALSKGPARKVVSLPHSEDGKRPVFRTAVFSSYLEFRAMDIVQNPSVSELCTIVRTL
jgi:hypothetical protein